MALEVGSVVEGTVTGITKFGAFVRLPGGKSGLIHISEIADEFVADVRNYVQEQQVVKVKILSVNEEGKYDLSLKQVPKLDQGGSGDKVKADERSKPSKRSNKAEPSDRFEDMLNKWKKESEERLLDVKRNLEAKRGGGRGRNRW